MTALKVMSFFTQSLCKSLPHTDSHSSVDSVKAANIFTGKYIQMCILINVPLDNSYLFFAFTRPPWFYCSIHQLKQCAETQLTLQFFSLLHLQVLQRFKTHVFLLESCGCFTHCRCTTVSDL